jgi:hypothetical protein
MGLFFVVGVVATGMEVIEMINYFALRVTDREGVSILTPPYLHHPLDFIERYRVVAPVVETPSCAGRHDRRSSRKPSIPAWPVLMDKVDQAFVASTLMGTY